MTEQKIASVKIQDKEFMKMIYGFSLQLNLDPFKYLLANGFDVALWWNDVVMRLPIFALDYFVDKLSQFSDVEEGDPIFQMAQMARNEQAKRMGAMSNGACK